MTLIKPVHAQALESLRDAHTENVPNIPFGATIADILSGDNFNLLDIIFFLVGVIFFFNIIHAAWGYVTASGNPQTIEANTKRLTNAILGIVIVLASYLLIRIIGRVIGFSDII